MRLCRFTDGEATGAGVLVDDRIVGIFELNRELGTAFPTNVDDLMNLDHLAALAEALPNLAGPGRDPNSVRLLSPLERPPKIWNIGLNYVEHASDLDEKSPGEPASFMRPAFSIIGPGETIHLPAASERVTGEAELAVVVGRTCRDVSEEEAGDYIAGFVPAIDMTAEDILRRNPRFLTRAKSFDTFLSLGPCVVTADEIGDRDALRQVRTSTRLNGEVKRSNIVSHMRHDPYKLIAFHSQGMTWLPGDVLLTGTPGAVVLDDGDVVASEVEGVGLLENPVARP